MPEETNRSQPSGPSLSSCSWKCEHKKEAGWERGGEDQRLASHSRTNAYPESKERMPLSRTQVMKSSQTPQWGVGVSEGHKKPSNTEAYPPD